MKLTTLHLVPRLRMSEVTSPRAFRVYTVTAVALLVTHVSLCRVTVVM
jgi:hypothetical protein